MLRKECASNEGLDQVSEISGTDSSEHAPGIAARSQAQLTIIPLGGRADGAAGVNVESGGQAPNARSTTTHGENRSDDEPELDPHICRQWPCPQCHKPRDGDDELTLEAGQYSAEAATSTQSFFRPHEPLQLEQSEDSDDDLLLDVVATSASHGSQNRKGHFS